MRYEAQHRERVLLVGVNEEEEEGAWEMDWRRRAGSGKRRAVLMDLDH